MFPLSGNKPRTRIPAGHVRILHRVAPFDLAWALVAPVLAFVIRDGTIKQTDVVTAYCVTAVFASLIAFQWFKISAPLADFFSINDVLATAKACLTTVALTTVVIFSFTRLADAPRSVPFIHFMLLTGGLVGVRFLARLISARNTANSYRAHGGPFENVLIVGATRLAWFFIKMVEELASRERVIAVLDERPRFHRRTLNGYPIVGSPSSLLRVVDEYATHGIEIGKIVVATRRNDLDDSASREIQAVCASRNIPIEWLPERLALPSEKSESADNKIKLQPPVHAFDDRLYWKAKPVLDVSLALVAMVMIAPLAVMVAVFVLFDVGNPVVFWQQRVGYLGRPLCVYKFRTMRNAFDRDGRPVPEAERVSVLGGLLRKSRLDEIPQLFNIVIGSMSFVGPRPLLPIDQPKNLRMRLQIRPGLTGLAQINGGKLLSPEEKDALDEWYLHHASLWLDLKIFVRTISVLLRGDTRNEHEVSAAVAERDKHFEAMAKPLRS